MAAATSFTLRPLERNTPNTALEGAFRVYLSIKELKALNLSNGDLIRLSTADKLKGFAIAWLTTQTNPGNKPIAKVTDLLREKYGLALNDRLFIEKADEDDWRPINSIEIGFVDLVESLNSYHSNDELIYWVRYALGAVALNNHSNGVKF